MHKIKSISLGPQHFEHLAALREQTGWPKPNTSAMSRKLAVTS